MTDLWLLICLMVGHLLINMFHHLLVRNDIELLVDKLDDIQAAVDDHHEDFLISEQERKRA